MSTNCCYLCTNISFKVEYSDSFSCSWLMSACSYLFLLFFSASTLSSYSAFSFKRIIYNFKLFSLFSRDILRFISSLEFSVYFLYFSFSLR